MNNGFTLEHFKLLEHLDGVARNNGDAAQDAAYRNLVQAYEATARWAEGVRASLFPHGYVRKLSKPTNQAQRFKPYTWTRIYPRENAPKELAYTVGIDADGSFCVKIDTIGQQGAVRRRYETLNGGSHRVSPFAASLSAERGVRLPLEQLIAWSTEQIGLFEPGYDALARELGLIDGPMRLVTEDDLSRAAFRRWSLAMSGGARRRGAVMSLDELRIVFSPGRQKSTVAIKLGLDPRGEEWAVEINEPAKAGDHNVLSAIGKDDTGALYLLRQGRLTGRRGSSHILEEEFARRTGLKSVAVAASGPAAKRRWFVVASLDGPPETIRRETASFTDSCWAARAFDADSVGEDDDFEEKFETPANDESAGFYNVGPRDATDARIVRQLQGEVWTALAEMLSASDIKFRKWKTRNGFAIDMEIVRKADDPVLLEIKSAASASDLYTGIGQLHLYRKLFGRLKGHVPVLLVQGETPDFVRKAIEGLGISFHTYQYERRGDESAVVFSPDFLAFCGVR